MCGTALCVFCVSGCTCHDCVCVCVAFALCVGVVRMFVVLCDGVCVHYTWICTCTVLCSECLVCVCVYMYVVDGHYKYMFLCRFRRLFRGCSSSTSHCTGEPHLSPDSSHAPPPGACAGEEVNPDLVSVYADRMCAVMHAFATVCTTLQRASGR